MKHVIYGLVPIKRIALFDIIFLDMRSLSISGEIEIMGIGFIILFLCACKNVHGIS